MDVILFLTGIAIGLSVSAPLGPVNILVIRNAIRRGFGVAFAGGAWRGGWRMASMPSSRPMG